jgi:peptidoglycan-associated lipoprotein
MNAYRIVYVSVALLSTLVAASCAKTPKTAGPSVPAPTGAAGQGAAEAGAPGAAARGEAGVAPGAGAPGAAPGAAAAERAEAGRVVAGEGAARPEPKEFAPTSKLRDIFFDFDEYVIRTEDAKVLDTNADWLQGNANYVVLVEGHCDERGTNEYNLALGEHRAQATKNYLMSRGVQASRVTTFSYGEERPFCIERTETCWATNRRAHFLIKESKGTR